MQLILNQLIGYKCMESNIKHKLWVEKYRPNSLENYICTDSVRTYVENSINKQDISHLLLAGPAGGGKTTLAQILY